MVADRICEKQIEIINLRTYKAKKNYYVYTTVRQSLMKLQKSLTILSPRIEKSRSPDLCRRVL